MLRHTGNIYGLNTRKIALPLLCSALRQTKVAFRAEK
jgi:hypothetical protein